MLLQGHLLKIKLPGLDFHRICTKPVFSSGGLVWRGGARMGLEPNVHVGLVWAVWAKSVSSSHYYGHVTTYHHHLSAFPDYDNDGRWLWLLSSSSVVVIEDGEGGHTWLSDSYPPPPPCPHLHPSFLSLSLLWLVLWAGWLWWLWLLIWKGGSYMMDTVDASAGRGWYGYCCQ